MDINGIRNARLILLFVKLFNDNLVWTNGSVEFKMKQNRSQQHLSVLLWLSQNPREDFIFSSIKTFFFQIINLGYTFPQRTYLKPLVMSIAKQKSALGLWYNGFHIENSWWKYCCKCVIVWNRYFIGNYRSPKMIMILKILDIRIYLQIYIRLGRQSIVLQKQQHLLPGCQCL